jgi:hypothetical protein
MNIASLDRGMLTHVSDRGGVVLSYVRIQLRLPRNE